MTEAPNPERRSNNAMICLCTGFGLLALTWVLGVGTAFTAVFSGGIAGMAMGMMGGVVLMLTAIVGVFLMMIGIVWVLVRVIADQTGEHARDRYKDVQR